MNAQDFTQPAQLRSHLKAALPENGLLAHGDWLMSPRPFPIASAVVKELEHLGYHFALFLKASDLLYRKSVNGSAPSWITEVLDQGKPAELVELARSKTLRNELPRIIRPDLMLTDSGFAASELDNLPGGIGLTAWLNETYAAIGFPVVGGSAGMLDGFSSVVADGDIVISDESEDYRLEMEWISARIGERGGKQPRVVREAEWKPERKHVYRFFELFDLPQVQSAASIFREMAAGELTVSPPPKPWLEEKLLFALFWLSPLREFWRRELGERHFERLQRVLPYTWMMNPNPLPFHASLPRLDINSWEALKHFSQKHRDYVLKISGFSPLGWGSRGVRVGSDLSQSDWGKALDEALSSYGVNPWILQEFRHPSLVTHPYFDRETGEVREMRGRVRLCPYYFVDVDGGAPKLGGILATIAPADKKLVHGMRDAILAPCMVVEEANAGE